MVKLSLTEKYAIQGMIHEGKDLDDIAKSLKRRRTTVEEYVNGELEELVNNVVRARQQAAMADLEDENEDEVPQPQEIVIPATLYKEALNFMRKNGFSDTDGKELLDNAVAQLTYIPADARELYNVAITKKGFGLQMVTKTAGGKEGVAIMTPAGSERGDIAHKEYADRKPTSRSARGNVWKPKQGRME